MRGAGLIDRDEDVTYGSGGLLLAGLSSVGFGRRLLWCSLKSSLLRCGLLSGSRLRGGRLGLFKQGATMSIVKS